MNLSGFARCLGVLAQIVLCVSQAGCAGTDRDVFAFNQSRSTVSTVTEVYRKSVPGFVRSGLLNFTTNIGYTEVLANNLLQGKIERAAADMQRIVVNSVALGGLLDVATPLGIPRYEEDFGQTLGVWGFGQGAYFNLPFVGPTTVRDMWRYPFRTFANPLSYVPFLGSDTPASVRFISTTVGAVTFCVDRLETSKLYEEAEQMADPYAYVKESYLRDRERLVRDLPPPRTAPGTFLQKPVPLEDLGRPRVVEEGLVRPDPLPPPLVERPRVQPAPPTPEGELPPPRIRIIRRGERP